MEAVQADEAPMGLDTDDDKLLADFEEALRKVRKLKKPKKEAKEATLRARVASGSWE